MSDAILYTDELMGLPTEDGEYLCKCLLFGDSEYVNRIINFDSIDGWDISNSCEHILWSIKLT